MYGMLAAVVWCGYIIKRLPEDLREWRGSPLKGVRFVIALYWLSLIPVGGVLIFNLLHLWGQLFK